MFSFFIIYITIRFIEFRTAFYDSVLDTKLKLHTKGPTAYLNFEFKANEVLIDNEPVRQVITTCRKFASSPGGVVPMILPDFNDPYYIHKARLEKSIQTTTLEYDPADFKAHIKSTFQDAVDTDHQNVYLGMRAFKLLNENIFMFNLITKPITANLVPAQYEPCSKAHIPYQYCNRMEKKDSGRTAQQLADIKKFKQMLPPRPFDRDFGFKEGNIF